MFAKESMDLAQKNAGSLLHLRAQAGRRPAASAPGRGATSRYGRGALSGTGQLP